jgi:hypothetical protein
MRDVFLWLDATPDAVIVALGILTLAWLVGRRLEAAYGRTQPVPLPSAVRPVRVAADARTLPPGRAWVGRIPSRTAEARAEVAKWN